MPRVEATRFKPSFWALQLSILSTLPHQFSDVYKESHTTGRFLGRRGPAVPAGGAEEELPVGPGSRKFPWGTSSAGWFPPARVGREGCAAWRQGSWRCSGLGALSTSRLWTCLRLGCPCQWSTAGKSPGARGWERPLSCSSQKTLPHCPITLPT